MANKDKTIKLRVFTIANNEPAHSKSPFLSLLADKLRNSTNVNERRIPVNTEDSDEDCISDYDDTRRQWFLNWTMIRIAVADSAHEIREDNLMQKKVPFEILNTIGDSNSFVCKSHYYFATDGIHIVTNLPINRTIGSYQAYLNEYLKAERGGELFEFTPLTAEPSETKAKEIKAIHFKDSQRTISVPSKNSGNAGGYEKQLINITKDKLSSLFNITSEFNKILEEGLISAELLIKFAKGKKNTEEYNKVMGAIMKPIADTGNIMVEKRNGEKITGEAILKTKLVEIEVTDSNNLNELQLFQEMEKFLNDLRQ